MASRIVFPVTFKVGTNEQLGWIHCIAPVAKFLGIDTIGQTATDAIAAAKVSVKAHARQYRMPDGTTLKSVQVKEFERALGIGGKVGGKKVIFQTGEAVGSGKSKRRISLRASPNLSNMAIIDSLAGLIPDSKVKRGDAPGTNEVSAMFTIGASQYLLMKYSAASGTATPAILTEEATIVAAVAKQKGSAP